MVLDFHAGQSHPQEGSRHNRADEGGAVAAHHHGNADMYRVHAELVPHSNQHRQQPVEIRVRTEHQCKRHGQHSDDKRQEPAHGLRYEGRQHICHMVHDFTVLQNAQEHACRQNGRGHHQRRACMGLDDFVLEPGSGIIDQEGNHAPQHKGVIGWHGKPYKAHDDEQGQTYIEPEHYKPKFHHVYTIPFFHIMLNFFYFTSSIYTIKSKVRQVVRGDGRGSKPV